MRSSIFSSEKPVAFFTAVFLTTIGIVTAYALYAQFWATAATTGQNTSATNRIRAEEYVDGRSSGGTVIVGSSLSALLPEDILSPAITNLALGGGGALTGLELIRRSPFTPRLVLVEINLLERPIDASFVAQVFAFPRILLRRHLHAARLSYQPVNLAFAMMKQRRGRPAPAAVPSEARERIVERNRAELSAPYESGVPEKGTLQLSRLMDDLKARGIETALFEMPIDTELAKLARPSAIRAAVMQRFPAEYNWLRISLTGPPSTSDGLHLVPADADIVARQIVAQTTTRIRAR